MTDEVTKAMRFRIERYDFDTGRWEIIGSRATLDAAKEYLNVKARDNERWQIEEIITKVVFLRKEFDQ